VMCTTWNRRLEPMRKDVMGADGGSWQVAAGSKREGAEDGEQRAEVRGRLQAEAREGSEG
jgi:hypothetical protein